MSKKLSRRNLFKAIGAALAATQLPGGIERRDLAALPASLVENPPDFRSFPVGGETNMTSWPATFITEELMHDAQYTREIQTHIAADAAAHMAERTDQLFMQAAGADRITQAGEGEGVEVSAPPSPIPAGAGCKPISLVFRRRLDDAGHRHYYARNKELE